MNMSRLIANTSHPVNNHYNSNPDTFRTNLIHAIFLTVSNRCPFQKPIPDAKLQLKRNRSDLHG
jgi:hypothetical protein